jgi:hypothetical protein
VPVLVLSELLVIHQIQSGAGDIDVREFGSVW